MTSVEGRVALVTGAGGGIGHAAARRLASEGASIVAVDRELPEALVDELGDAAHACVADSHDLESLEAAVASGMNAFGRLDVVVANAGVLSAIGKTWEVSEEDWTHVLDVNLTGTWRTLKAAIPAMIEAGHGGSIVLTSSCAAMVGVRRTAAYAASKHGLSGLLKTLVNEISQYSIRVNSVHPTTVETDMVLGAEALRRLVPGIENPSREDFAESFQQYNALPVPWVQPIDVAEAIAWLAGDESRYVTGVQLPVDAGYLTKV